MRRLGYFVLLAISLWFFMSPFIIKTAETLQGRAAGEFIGLIGILASWYGLKTGKRGPASAVILTGALAILWGVIGGKVLGFGGMAHNVFIGVLLIVLAVINRSLTPREEFSVEVNSESLAISDLKVEHGKLLAMSEKGGVEKSFAIDGEALWVALSSLDYESAKRLFMMLNKGRGAANSRKS